MHVYLSVDPKMIFQARQINSLNYASIMIVLRKCDRHHQSKEVRAQKKPS